MFTYYLSSLHEFREKNLELGQTTSHAWMEMVTHLIDGQYLIGRAVLHPATLQPGHYADPHWEHVTNNDHQELVMKWIDESVAKTTRVQEIVFASFAHNATGWSEFGHEFIRKLKRDAGPDYAEALQLVDRTVQEVADAELMALKSALKASAPRKPATAKEPPKKPAVKNATKASKAS